MDKRCRLILERLIESKEPVTSDELSVTAGVTSRTIKSDIKKIAEFLPEFGAELKAKPGIGYEVVVSDTDIFSEFKMKLRFESRDECKRIPQSKFQRINYIIMKLLTVDYYLDVDDLAEEMFIEKSTLLSYLKEIKTILKSYKLSIVKDSRQGIIIEGSEIHKRICISEFFFHNDMKNYIHAEDSTMFSSLSSKHEIRKIREILLKVMKQYSIQLSAFSVENMSIHIVVALRRWMLYDYVRIGENASDKIKGTTEEVAGKQLVSELESEFGIILPGDEAVYFALHLKSKRINVKTGVWKSPEEKQKLMNTLKEIFDSIEKRFGMHFHDDTTIEKYLLLHLKAMIERLEIGFSVRNAQAYEQKREYLMAAMLTQTAVDIIEKNYGIVVEENEEGFLILYFNLALYRMNMKSGLRIAVTNGSGRPEGIILLNKITQARIGIPDVITLIDVTELEDINEKDYDIIISTTELVQITAVPVVILGNTAALDTERLQRVIDLSRLGRIDFKVFFPENALFIGVKGTERGAVFREIKKLLQERSEEKAAADIDGCICSEIGEGCALLFGASPPESCFMKVFCLRKPVVMMNHAVQMIFWVDAPRKEVKRLNVLLALLSEWLSTPKNVSVFRQQPSYKKLITEFEKMQTYID